MRRHAAFHTLRRPDKRDYARMQDNFSELTGTQNTKRLEGNIQRNFDGRRFPSKMIQPTYRHDWTVTTIVGQEILFFFSRSYGMFKLVLITFNELKVHTGNTEKVMAFGGAALLLTD